MSAPDGTADRAAIVMRRDEILAETATRETPPIMITFVVLVAIFDVIGVMNGHEHSLPATMSDVILACYLIAVAVLIRNRDFPARLSPTLFASAVVVALVSLCFEYALEPDSNTLGIMAIMLAACGPLILMWRPFIIAMAAMAALSVYTVVAFTPYNMTGWILTVFMAIGMSAVLLYGRWRSASLLATATMTIEALATRDPLTGVLNRHGLDVAGPTIIALAARRGDTVFAVFVDIVGLKVVNDAHGHATGDLVIQRTSRAIESVSRGSDVVVRWGGDEFIVVGIGPQPDPRVYEGRITEALDLTDLDGAWDGSVSIGTASTTRDDVNALIRAADKAMYQNRSHHGKGIAPATPAVHDRHT